MLQPRYALLQNKLVGAGAVALIRPPSCLSGPEIVSLAFQTGLTPQT